MGAGDEGRDAVFLGVRGFGGLLSGVYSVEDVVSGVDPSFGGVGGKLKELEVGGCTERGAVGLWCLVLYGLILGHPEWA